MTNYSSIKIVEVLIPEYERRILNALSSREETIFPSVAFYSTAMCSNKDDYRPTPPLSMLGTGTSGVRAVSEL